MSKGQDNKIKLCPTDEHYASPETVRRVLEVADMIVDGEPRYKLIQYMKDKYELGNQSATLYYDAALRYLIPSEEEKEGFREKMQAKLLSRYEKLYKEAVDRNSLKIAKEILDSMAKIYGVSGGDKVTVREDANGDKEIEIVFN